MVGYFLTSMKQVGAGLAIISISGSGAGVGYIFGSLILAYAKNPSLKGQLFVYSLVGFALCEAIALMGLVVTFVILFG